MHCYFKIVSLRSLTFNLTTCMLVYFIDCRFKTKEEEATTDQDDRSHYIRELTAFTQPERNTLRVDFVHVEEHAPFLSQMIVQEFYRSVCMAVCAFMNIYIMMISD